MWAFIPAVVFCALLAAAAYADLTSLRIPNLVCLLLAVSGLVLNPPIAASGWTWRAASALVTLGATLPLYLRGGLGGGDLKLLLATACWIPFATLGAFVIPLGLAGGVQALGVIAVRRVAGGAHEAKRRMPYAVSIAVAGGVWLALGGLR